MQDLTHHLAGLTGLGDGTATLLLVSAAFLLAGTAYRFTRWWPVRERRDEAAEARHQRFRSAGTWWMLFLGGTLLLSLGLVALLPLLALLALLLVRETLALARRIEEKDATGTGLKVGAVALGLSGPVFLAATALLPAPAGLADERFGWLVLLLFLTELHDITQSWWGRLFGRHKMTPRLSPHKTWEGLAGGFASTMTAAVFVAPTISSYGRTFEPGWVACLGLGFVLGTAGIAGDLSASYLKRRAGVKDAGRSLPGHGGFLDRFDSLALTAPTYFVLTFLLFPAGSP